MSSLAMQTLDYPATTASAQPLSQILLQPVYDAITRHDPYPFIMAGGVLPARNAATLIHSFPDIDYAGFFPINLLQYGSSFEALLKELSGPEIADILSEKLDIDLCDKPRFITVRKWSAAKDGRIHNDGGSKLATALLYLNPRWESHESAGNLRVLRNNFNYENAVAEVPPLFGNFIAFRRTENSWHGHKPFIGERRVIQVTWLRSMYHFNRKQKRGGVSHMLKRFFASSYEKKEYPGAQA